MADQPEVPGGAVKITLGNRSLKEAPHMPHDRNGALLKVGDKVSVPCVVTSISEGTEYCNLSLETEHPMYPGKDKTAVVVNNGQVIRTMDDPGRSDPPPPPDPPPGQDGE
jgi:hypothetical protein